MPIPPKQLAFAASLVLLGAAFAVTNAPEARAEPPAAAKATPDVPLAKTVAERYGLAGWGEVQELRYTFNVMRGGELKGSRSWVWRPIDGTVTLIGKEEEGEGDEAPRHTWPIGKPEDSEEGRGRDHAFINDQYWLVFPFHLIWDDNAKLEALGTHPPPFGEGQTQRLAISYLGEAGYTPGDRYDLFVGEKGLITHWTYTPAGASEPKMAATWEEHTQLGPLTISLSHRSEDGGFGLFFSDVAVVTAEGTFEATSKLAPAAKPAPAQPQTP